MNQPVAQTDDLRPRNLGISCAVLAQRSAGCLADDFQQPHKRELEKSISVQISWGLVLCKSDRFPSVVQHMAEGKVPIPPWHAAPQPQLAPARESKD